MRNNISRFVVFVLVLVILSPVNFIYADDINDGYPTDTEPALRFGGPLNNVPRNIPGVGQNIYTPCRNIDDSILEDRSVNIQPGDVGSGAGEVPVYDNDLNRNLTILVQAIRRSYEFSEFQDGDVQRTAEYLRLLCEKEYEEDHTLQHAYAELIGKFVSETQKFIHKGFSGNPAFLTSQEAYYLLVDIGVRRVFMQDVADSARIGNKKKREIIEAVAANLFSDKYPTNDSNLPAGYVPEIAPDNLPESLSNNVYDSVQVGEETIPGGYAAINRLYAGEDADGDAIVEEALNELNDRIAKQTGYEQEKLAWGRGFFSYEICDLAVFVRNQGEAGETVNDEDRRNCRISTPGSLIQDQTSLVFGTAIRQMELNDEYEEWIAPNTLAVLSDILSWRGLNNVESRNPNSMMDAAGAIGQGADPQYVNDLVSSSPISPVDIQDSNNADFVDLESLTPYPANQPQNFDGWLPIEFDTIVDVDLFDAAQDGAFGNSSGGSLIGSVLFNDILDPYRFLP